MADDGAGGSSARALFARNEKEWQEAGLDNKNEKFFDASAVRGGNAAGPKEDRALPVLGRHDSAVGRSKIPKALAKKH